jgi:hypothetical protein
VRTLILVIFLLSVSSAVHAFDGKEIQDNGGGRLPQCPADTSVPWNNCEGALTMPNGDKYVGEFRDGKPNGQGVITWTNGSKYVGGISDGKMNGKGTLMWPDGRPRGDDVKAIENYVKSGVWRPGDPTLSDEGPVEGRRRPAGKGRR